MDIYLLKTWAGLPSSDWLRGGGKPARLLPAGVACEKKRCADVLEQPREKGDFGDGCDVFEKYTWLN